MTKNNETAIDLWTKIFGRASTKPWATIVDPEYDEAGDRERFREAMATAGWSADEIKLAEKSGE